MRLVNLRCATKKGVKTLSRAKLDDFLAAQQIDWETTQLSQLKPSILDQLLRGSGKFEGVLNLLEKEFATTTSSTRLEQLAALRGRLACPACGGSRLRPEATAVRLGGKAIHELTSLTVGRTRDFLSTCEFASSDLQIAHPILKEIDRRLEFLTKGVQRSCLSANH